MADFFAGRGDGPGLALFLNAGDPPLEVLADLIPALDDVGVDCLELAVPFPDSVTDGPVIRRSAQRALAAGADLDSVLALVARVRPGLRRMRIALLTDWSHSLKRRPLAEAIREIADSGADGLLVHALPPRLSEPYLAATRAAGLPVVTTCYHGTSTPQTMAKAATHASAYLYLVAHYGRSGTRPGAGYDGLAASVAHLRGLTTAPIAVGFGVRTRADVAAVHACGADAAIVGSAAVATVEESLLARRDVVEDLCDFARHLQPAAAPFSVSRE
ncbi:tryptophan synthase subunit alpha [Micromonospora sp. NPDC051925]|uniref:tryptophan synthase subunit alpha n=1 Tax=Micromonospora sp. NPDC051925 TaxID=3364288 RepID=UPI0037C838BE